MIGQKCTGFGLGVAILLGAVGLALAGEADVVAAQAVRDGEGVYRFHVSVSHGDSGWDHYADAWRIVDGAGHLLKTRVLYHPHTTEQPFTRSLSNISIPAGTDAVYVEAHDKRHGWSEQRIKVDLTRSSGERYHIRRK